MSTSAASTENSSNYRDLFETMDLGVVYQDSEGTIISANPAAEKILGLSLNQMKGRTSIHPEWKAVNKDKLDLPGEQHPAMLALRTRKKILNFILGIFNPQLKDYVWILVSSIPQFRKGSKKPYQVYSTFLNITARHKIEEELKALNQQLQANEQELKASEQQLRATNQQLAANEQQLRAANQALIANEQELKQSEKFSRSLIRFMPDGFSILDEKGKHVDVNESFCKMTGFTKEEIIGTKPPFLYWPEEEIENISEALSNTMKGKWNEFELIFKKKSGERFPVIVSPSQLKDDKGNVINNFATVKDITKRKQTEEALAHEKDFIEALLESIPGYLYVYDDQGNLIRWNKKHETMTGYSAEELSRMNMSQWFEGDDAIRVAAAVEEVMTTGYGEVEANLLIKGGGKLLIHSNGVRLILNGKTYFTGVGIDITERKKAEEQLNALNQQLQANEQQFRAANQQLQANEQELIKAKEKAEASEQRMNLVIKGSNDAPWDWDLIHDELFYSPQWWKQIGYNPNEIPTNSSLWENLMHPDDKILVDEIYGGALKNGQESYAVEFRLLHKQGYYVPVLSRGFITFDENKNPIRVSGTNLDLTERKRAEAEMLKAKETAERYLDMAGSAFLSLDVNGNILLVNQKALEILEYDKAEELVGKNWFDTCIPSEIIEQVKQVFSQVIIGKMEGVEQLENEVVTKLGKRKLIDWSNSYIKDEKGQIKYLLSSGLDITKRKQAEESLRKIEWMLSKKKLLPPENDNEEYVPRYGNLTRLNTNRLIYDSLGADVLKDIASDYLSLLDTSSAIYEKNGDYALGIFSSGWCRFMDQASYKLCNTDDSVEALNSGKWLCHESCWKDASLAAINTGCATDIECSGGIRMYAEPIKAGKKIIGAINFGYGAPPQDQDKLLELAQKYNVPVDELIKKAKEYETRPSYMIELAKTRLQTTSKLIGEIVSRKMTEQQITKTNIELIKAKEKAEESDRLKSAFLANMSHEIRTPMNGILGFTDLLKEPGLTGKQQKDYIEIIQKSGDRMLNTVNDIIEISRIETGQIKLVSNLVNISDHLTTLCIFFRLEAENKGLKLILDNNLTQAESLIKTDKNKFGSIVTNLIKNAIKYTDKGSITIGCNKKGEFLEFYVTDTGIGIPANRIVAIFNRFEQADIEDSRALQGSGLGLSIVKSYVEMLGGEIWVESEEGVGSQFYFTHPYKTTNIEIPETNREHSNKPLSLKKGLKILIAEDDETAIAFLKIVLKEYEKEMLIAKNGIETVEMCRNNPDLDMVLMDIKMPGLNGYEATQQIREFNKNVYILAQTAYAQLGDREKAIVVGCNDYISKPIQKDELFGKLEKYFNQ